MNSTVIYNTEVRARLKAGVDKLANAVKVTLGPKGRNVIIDRKYGAPHITKDGVTVAKDILLEDPVERMGAELVKEVASKTNDKAGDGTTTATVLAQAIIKEGLKNVTAGTNPIGIKSGIDKGVSYVKAFLKENSKSINSYDETFHVASISANGDKAIGTMVADAMKEVGTSGVITVEEAKATKSSLEVVKGMQFHRGYLSPYFITDTNTSEVILDDVVILISNNNISNIKELVPILEQVSQTSKSLLIIADDVEGEALATLVVNRLRGSLKVAAVRAPGFGEKKKEQLEDMAILTGAKFMTEELGIKISDMKLSDLGSAKSVVIDKDNTKIIDGGGTVEAVEKRITLLETLSNTTENEYDKEKYQERLARLAGGVAVIKVGASSEVEMKEIKDRVDDALNATRCAVEEGIVPGGGVALLRASIGLDRIEGLSDEELIGLKLFQKALSSPIRQILSNAGLDGSVVINKILEEDSFSYGYNARTETFEDVIKSGVIDPTKVTISALENASSVASLLLTTEAALYSPSENTCTKENDPVYY